MAYKPIFSLKQHLFPKINKEVLVDIKQRKIKIKQQSLLKSEELDIELDRINPNAQKIKRWALMWFFTALGLSGYFIACVSTWLWKPSLSVSDTSIYLLVQALLLVAASMSWWRFSTNSFNLTIFFDKYTAAPLFSLFTHNPEPESFNHFVESLKKTIINQEQTRSIQSILNEIPTHILVEEFSSSYIDELAKRGIDVSALLSFLQKRAMNSHEINQRPSLQ